MKKLIGLTMLALVLSVGMVPMLYAADVTEPPTPKMVNGDLLKIEGDFYVVKDLRNAGKEVRLHVDQTTQLEGTFKASDKVEVQATASPRPFKGGFVDHAVSIKHVQPAK